MHDDDDKFLDRIRIVNDPIQRDPQIFPMHNPTRPIVTSIFNLGPLVCSAAVISKTGHTVIDTNK